MRTARTKAITARFITVVNIIIHESKMGRGKYNNYLLIAESLSEIPQNFSKVLKGKQDVSLSMIESIGRVHNVNANWLNQGKGEMFMKDEGGTDAHSIARKLRTLANQLEQLNQVKLRKRA